MTKAFGGRVVGHLKSAARRNLAAIWIGGGTMLIGGAWAVGYSTAPARAPVRTVEQIVQTPDETENARLRQKVQVLKNLVVRYQEELAYVDEQLETLKGVKK